MKFTAQQIKFALAIDDPAALEKCKVDKSDRQYQVWKRKPLSVELSTEKVFMQNLPAGRQDWIISITTR